MRASYSATGVLVGRMVASGGGVKVGVGAAAWAAGAAGAAGAVVAAAAGAWGCAWAAGAVVAAGAAGAAGAAVSSAPPQATPIANAMLAARLTRSVGFTFSIMRPYLVCSWLRDRCGERA